MLRVGERKTLTGPRNALKHRRAVSERPVNTPREANARPPADDDEEAEREFEDGIEGEEGVDGVGEGDVSPQGRRRRVTSRAAAAVSRSRANQERKAIPLNRLKMEEELRRGWQRKEEDQCQVCFYDHPYAGGEDEVDDDIVECEGCQTCAHMVGNTGHHCSPHTAADSPTASS